MKKLKDEFYANFHESMEVVNAGIIASKITKEVEICYAEDSTRHVQTRTIMRFISLINEAIKNGDIYKKCIFSYFSNYPKQRVLMAISKLTDDHIKILFDFSSLEENELLEDLSGKYNSDFRFKCILKNIEDILEGRVKQTSFYSIFPKNTKEEILKCMELLSNYEKYLVFKKYGENLDGNGVYMTPEENSTFRNQVVKKMKRYLISLRNGYQILGLLDVYPNLTRQELKGYIDKLAKETKNYFYRIFGKNLDKKRIIPSSKNLITVQFKESLDRVINYKGKKLKPFFEIFENLKMEDESLEDFKKRVINAVNTLMPNNLIITKHIYGEDFENLYAPANITDKEMRHFFNNITPSIKKRLGKCESLNVEKHSYDRNIKTFFERFPHNDLFLQYVTYEVSLLDDRELGLLVKRYGINLDEIHEVSEEEKTQVNRIVSNIRQRVYRKISRELGVSLDKIYKIRHIYYNSIIREIFSDMDLNIVVSVLSYLYIDNISKEEIIRVLGINPLIHLESVKCFLEEKGVNIKTLKIKGDL